MRFGRTRRATLCMRESLPMKDDRTKVTLTEPDLAGSYVVTEQHDDGTLVLRPETGDDQVDARVAAEAETRRIVERHRDTFDELAK